ncbi:MAG: hypothetical protein ISEC1_P1371 [Thiomicrorhabdus sp.]|nr:MAG: hypothetical protein ISEC1_P1371 [Thiomicrorhabdus sp.]
MPKTQIKIHNAMDEFSKSEWNSLLHDDNPFLRYEFLHALEANQCVSPQFGWIPRHIGLYQNDQLIAAMPLYEKHNNYGEFVFDQAWADAWQQVGLDYYPKLVSAIPYSPVLGQRLLVDPKFDNDTQENLKGLLIRSITSICQQNELSGVHLLFSEKNQQNWLSQQQDWLYRQDCQFHWINQGYQSFDDFLATLTAKKRKNIKQERKSVKAAGITFRVLNGHTVLPEDWVQFDIFYQKTFNEKWGTPTLNCGFFQSIADNLPDQIILVLADSADGQCIAGSLMFQSKTHLYGRHWGITQAVKNLHFETCFYQGIEHAIKQSIQVFEPGAGGEHKIARGFVPVAMQSAHWLTQNPFPEGIDHFIEQEKLATDDYMADSLTHVPYKDKTCFYQQDSHFTLKSK